MALPGNVSPIVHSEEMTTPTDDVPTLQLEVLKRIQAELVRLNHEVTSLKAEVAGVKTELGSVKTELKLQRSPRVTHLRS